MSTRANIIIENNNYLCACLYRHHDGDLAYCGKSICEAIYRAKKYNPDDKIDIAEELLKENPQYRSPGEALLNDIFLNLRKKA